MAGRRSRPLDMLMKVVTSAFLGHGRCQLWARGFDESRLEMQSALWPSESHAALVQTSGVPARLRQSMKCALLSPSGGSQRILKSHKTPEPMGKRCKIQDKVEVAATLG